MYNSTENKTTLINFLRDSGYDTFCADNMCMLAFKDDAAFYLATCVKSQIEGVWGHDAQLDLDEIIEFIENE